MALVAAFVVFALVDPEIGIPVLLIGAVVEVGEAIFWVRYLKRFRVRTGAEGLIGERAEVLEACDPKGKVKLMGEIWNAECEAGAEAGTSVEITEVNRLTLKVKPLAGALPR